MAFEAIRVAELERLEPKLAALPPDARARIDDVTRLLVERLLSAPTEQLKAATDEEAVAAYAEALNRLFRLSDRPSKANTAARDQAIDPIATTSRGRGR